jgi:hypothetical protein
LHNTNSALTNRDLNRRCPSSAAAHFRYRASQPHLSPTAARMQDDSMTFKSMSTSGTASSKASSLFDLDQHGSKSILVYKYRSGAKGLEVRTEQDLCEELDKGMSLSSCRMAFSNIARHRTRSPIHACYQKAYSSRQQSSRDLRRGSHAPRGA